MCTVLPAQMTARRSRKLRSWTKATYRKPSYLVIRSIVSLRGLLQSDVFSKHSIVFSLKTKSYGNIIFGKTFDFYGSGGLYPRDSVHEYPGDRLIERLCNTLVCYPDTELWRLIFSNRFFISF